MFDNGGPTGDMLVFSSIAGIQDYVEWIDVENSEYVGFDDHGTRLHFSVVIDNESRSLLAKWFGLGGPKRVSVSTVEESVVESETLHEYLAEWLGRYDRLDQSESDLRQLRLSEVVEIAARTAGIL